MRCSQCGKTIRERRDRLMLPRNNFTLSNPVPEFPHPTAWQLEAKSNQAAS